jgi:hypothetical protein
MYVRAPLRTSPERMARGLSAMRCSLGSPKHRGSTVAPSVAHAFLAILRWHIRRTRVDELLRRHHGVETTTLGIAVERGGIWVAGHGRMKDMGELEGEKRR